MGNFQGKTIKEVITELNYSYFLPDIQREYVWLNNQKAKKIEQLFDSILRGYPIGAFLFWKLKKDDIEVNNNSDENSDKLNFQLYKFIENYDERRVHNEKINVEQINSDNLSIVLDGQQRLTSLYIGLKGSRTLKRPKAWWDNPNAFEEKKLYINLRYKPDDEDPDDNYKFEFLKGEELHRKKEDTYWYKVGDILECDNVFAYASENNLSAYEVKVLEDLKVRFCKDPFISFFEESEKNLDKVLKIFIRVNSGGTQLSYSDLLMSILTANFSSNIRDLMNKTVDNISEKGFGVMGRDQILKTCLLMTESDHKFQLKNFNKTNIMKIEENWMKIIDSIFSAITLLTEFGYRDKLSSGYILSIVSYYLYKACNKVTEDDKNEILRFIRNAQIKRYFTTSLDEKLKVIANILRNSDSFNEINDKLKKNPMHSLFISEEDIKCMSNYQYGNPAVFPILQILYPNLNYRTSTFHIDHIYPKSKFNNKNAGVPEDYYDRGNYLYNLQLLLGEHNICKKDKDPEIWLKEHYSDNEEDIARYKKENYIDSNICLEWKHIKEFDESRSKKLIEKLKKELRIVKAEESE